MQNNRGNYSKVARRLTRQSQLPHCPITVAGASVEPVSVVHDLGVYIDSDLGAATHVSKNLVALFRRIATASSSTLPRYQ